MKKIIAILILFVSSYANAINTNIGFPVSAARLGLSGSVDFTIDCAKKDLTIQESTNVLFSQHIKKNISVMCYLDKDTHNVRMEFKKDLFNQNMIARQHNRYFAP